MLLFFVVFFWGGGFEFPRAFAAVPFFFFLFMFV